MKRPTGKLTNLCPPSEPTIDAQPSEWVRIGPGVSILPFDASLAGTVNEGEIQVHSNANKTTMETRKLLAWMSMALDPEAEDAVIMVAGSSDQIYRRQNVPYFNPTPDEIRAAVLEIQAEWTDDERMTRAGPAARRAQWCLPRVRTLGMAEPEE